MCFIVTNLFENLATHKKKRKAIKHGCHPSQNKHKLYFCVNQKHYQSNDLCTYDMHINGLSTETPTAPCNISR